MPLLDVALAFSLTMLAVSTAVSQCLNLIFKLLGTRAVQFRAMLGRYLQNDFAPVLERELSRLNREVSQQAASVLGEKAAAYQEQVLKALAPPGARTGGAAAKSRPEDVAALAAGLEKVTALSTAQLLEQLKRSEFGLELYQQLGNKAEGVFSELARTWETVGEDFTQSFRSHSRYWGTAVAFVLALAVNIDSVFILQSYYSNVGSRDVVLQQGQRITSEYDKLMTTLSSQPQVAGDAGQQLKEAALNAQAATEVLRSGGLPLGFEYFPHIGATQPESQQFTSRATPLGWLSWLTGIALTALLAGLGAPFWYDAVSGITNVARKTRGGAPPSPQ